MKKVILALYIALACISAFVFLYEVLDVKTSTIDNYVDCSYGYTQYDVNTGDPVNPGETERRYANVPWYAFPLNRLEGYGWTVLLFLIPITTIVTIIASIKHWRELRYRLLIYIPLLLFAAYTVVYSLRDF